MSEKSMDAVNNSMEETSRLKAALDRLAGQMRSAPPLGGETKGGGSLQRGLPDDVRKAFIAVRAVLFQRGIFNPVLVRFDSATAAPASNIELADELTKLARSV